MPTALNRSAPESSIVARRVGLFASLGALLIASSCGSSSSESHGVAGTGAAGAGGAAHGSGGSRSGGAAGARAGSEAAGESSDGGAAGVPAGVAGEAGALSCPEPDPALTNDDDPIAMPEPDPTLAGAVHHFFKIVVRDAASQVPIPGATLTTVNEIPWTSDQNGAIAFYEPGMMGQKVFFTVSHPGYEYPADGFGVHGLALSVSEGGTVDLSLNKLSGESVPVLGDLQTRLASGPVPGPKECMAIRVADAQNQRGVPLVRLSAFGEDYWSDSQGMIAYCNPDHVGEKIAFSVFSHGYTLSNGTSSVTIETSKAGAARVDLQRLTIAARLYRMIGAGIYRDSVLLGLKTPLAKPVLNAQLLGSDTASSTVYRGKVFTIWGDTNRLSYVLGNFHGTAATSLLPSQGGLSPNLGVDYTYFVGDDGFAAPMCDGCVGGPAWMSGLASVLDAQGAERLFAGYVVVDSNMNALESGLARFDDSAQHFERVITNYLDYPDFIPPRGHDYPFSHGAARYIYYGDRLRIPASAEAFLDPARYEQYTPYGGSGSATLLRNADGRLNYQWRAGARHVTSAALKAAGVGSDQDFDGHAIDPATGNPIVVASGESVAWNSYRKRFVDVYQQEFGGSSFIGEIWHAEADTPLGPFVYARKIISHDNYTFYNTLHHPELDRGRFMYVEGTYTRSYSSATTPTPRYDYNQQMYRVDLEDPALNLPVAVYDLGGTLPGNFGTKAEVRRDMPAMAAPFMAPDRPGSGLVGVAWTGPACAIGRELVASAEPPTAPLFYALPGDTDPAPPATVPLYEYHSSDGRFAYGLADAKVPAGFTRAARPLALVWQNPVSIELPVADYLGDLVANAGEDRCLSATRAGGADVTLDASASSSIAGAISKVLWHVPGARGCAYLVGTKVTVHLEPGTYDISVEVTDTAGNVAHDALIVRVS